MIKINKKDILACFLILLATIATLRIPYIQNGDELWTFANTYKLYNGISLYNENNIIVTPLFFWIGNILFNILGPTFLTYKIYNILLIFVLYLGVYKLLKCCNIRQDISIILTIIFMLLYKIINIAGANYTDVALIFFIIGVINLVKNKEKNINIIFQGIIVFLIFLTKQNIALYYLMGLSIYIFIKKNRIKNIIKLFFAITIPILIFLVYEYCIGELSNFINYAFLGMGEFAKNNIIVEGSKHTQILIGIQIVSIIVAIYQFIDNKKANKKDETLLILLIFGISNIMLGYPIFNLYHVSTGLLIPSILIAYIIYGYTKKIKINEDEKAIVNNIIRNITVILSVLIVVLIGKFVIETYTAFNNDQRVFTKDDPFYGGIIFEEESEYDEVMKFIKEKEQEGYSVIIFDIRANFYMVPLGKNNQNYDLPMLGNWGRDGENRVLESIKNRTNTYFLTHDENKDIYVQDSKKIKDYIKENFKNDGKIGKYDIYYK